MRRLLIASATALIAMTAQASANSVVYRCAINLDLTADYSADTVTVLTQGLTFTLPIAPSGSGARYSDGKTTIWEHQGEATFETPGVSLTGCKVHRLSVTPPA